MRILQRYILRELWLPCVMCILILNFIFMGGYLVRTADFIIGRGVSLFDTLYFLIISLPEMMSFTIPMSLLAAVLIIFGNLSQGNEIRAMKASGVHPMHVMVPAFLVGLALSFGMFVFNDQIMTYATFEQRRAMKQLLIKNPTAVIEPGRFVKLSDTVTFLAKELHGNQIKDVVAYENEGSDKPIRTIVAERGEIITNPNRSSVQIQLYDGSVSDSQGTSVQSIQFKTYEFPTMGQEDIRNMKKKIRDLTLAELLVYQTKPDVSERDKKEAHSSFHQRIAFAFGAFIFVFVGVPVAILVRRGEIVLSFIASVTAAGFYYILFVGAKTFSIQTAFPPLLAFWIPNLLLLWLGGYLLRRALIS